MCGVAASGAAIIVRPKIVSKPCRLTHTDGTAASAVTVLRVVGVCGPGGREFSAVGDDHSVVGEVEFSDGFR